MSCFCQPRQILIIEKRSACFTSSQNELVFTVSFLNLANSQQTLGDAHFKGPGRGNSATRIAISIYYFFIHDILFLTTVYVAFARSVMNPFISRLSGVSPNSSIWEARHWFAFGAGLGWPSKAAGSPFSVSQADRDNLPARILAVFFDLFECTRFSSFDVENHLLATVCSVASFNSFASVYRCTFNSVNTGQT